MKTFIVALAVSMMASTAYAGDCMVTLDQYRALKMKMTYAEAVAVFGCEGDEMARIEVSGLPITAMYIWHGAGIANTVETFQDDKLISRVQIGLTK